MFTKVVIPQKNQHMVITERKINGVFMLPIHPGEILKEEYMVPLNLSVSELALELLIPPSRIDEIIAERRGISVDTALRLAKFFGTDLNLWINLQAQYEANTMSDKAKKELERIVPYSVLHEVEA